MIDKFEVSIGDGSVLSFRNLDVDQEASSVRLGCDNNVFEIDIMYIGNTIQSGICVLCTDMKEKTINLPSYSKLEKTYTTPFFTEGPMDYSYAADFKILYDNNDVNVVIGDIEKIHNYTESNRLVFYFDDDFNLINIRIKDLTPEEYNFLKTEELNPGSYMLDNGKLEKDEFNQYRDYENNYLKNIDLYNKKYDIIDIDEEVSKTR